MRWYFLSLILFLFTSIAHATVKPTHDEMSRISDAVVIGSILDAIDVSSDPSKIRSRIRVKIDSVEKSSSELKDTVVVHHDVDPVLGEKRLPKDYYQNAVHQKARFYLTEATN